MSIFAQKYADLSFLRLSPQERRRIKRFLEHFASRGVTRLRRNALCGTCGAEEKYHPIGQGRRFYCDGVLMARKIFKQHRRASGQQSPSKED